jgi:uncharacterized protein (UPF0261 family)
VGKTIALVGALDTKGTEYDFVRRCIENKESFHGQHH